VSSAISRTLTTALPTRSSVRIQRSLGVAAQAFAEGTADHAYIYTTDVAAGKGAETVFASEGYDDSVTYVNGFRFVEDLLE